MVVTVLICAVLAIQLIFLVLVFVGLSKLEKNKELRRENERLQQLLTEHERKHAPRKHMDRGDSL